MVWVNPKSNYFAMGTFGMRFFGAVILLFCCGVFQNGQAADDAVFGLCDVGDVISARNGSLVPSKGKDCTRVILAPRGWRIKFTLYEIAMYGTVTSIHDGGTVVGTLKREFLGGVQGLVVPWCFTLQAMHLWCILIRVHQMTTSLMPRLKCYLTCLINVLVHQL